MSDGEQVEEWPERWDTPCGMHHGLLILMGGCGTLILVSLALSYGFGSEAAIGIAFILWIGAGVLGWLLEIARTADLCRIGE